VAHGAIGPDDAVLDRLELAAVAQVLDDADDAVAIVRMRVLDHVLRRWRDRARLEAEDAEHAVRPARLALGRRPLPAADLRQLLGGLQERLPARCVGRWICLHTDNVPIPCPASERAADWMAARVGR
jgi:hypothetical protein